MMNIETGSQTPERRTQTRISAEIPIRVHLPTQGDPLKALNQDISWGGARFLIGSQFTLDQPLSRDSGPLQIVFPWVNGERISIEATVARAQRLGDGKHQVAVRFSSLSPRNQSRLEKLLTMLYPRAHGEDGSPIPTLVNQLAVDVEEASEMRRMLQEVSTGRLTVNSTEYYAADQSLRLVLRGDNDLPKLKLRGRVINVDAIAVPDSNWPQLYALTLEFEHPLPMIKHIVSLLLEQIPEEWRPQDSTYDPSAPDWLRSMNIAHPTESFSVYLGAESYEQCALEMLNPDALGYLISAWGDPVEFDNRFQDLTMGDRAEPGGWPEDAWEELGMLQDVHDLVYGVPPVRSDPLHSGGRVS